LGNPSGLFNYPTDMAGIYDNGSWYMFVTNAGSNSLLRLNLGTSLAPTTVTGNDLGNFGYKILVPSSLSLNRDCGGLYAYVTDSTSNQLVCVRMASALGSFYAVDYSDIGSMNLPTGVSSIVRCQNDLYAYICNEGDSSLTKIQLFQCNNSSIPSFNEVTPPAYYYDSPGVYNIYYVINEGLPSVDVECKTITVLPKPTETISPSVNMCLNDTAKIWAISVTADSIRWTKNYRDDTTFLRQDSVRVWPNYSLWYPVVFYYPSGCITTDSVYVNISQVYADAGPDRTISDGASTILGGPNCSEGPGYTYYWQPYQYLGTGDTLIPNPVAAPPYDYTYFLTVTELNDGLGCTAYDTVTVHVNCGDFVVPNAFSPSSANSGVNKFGILNNQIAHLNYFRVYDRWGTLVFQTNDPTGRWDGTFNNTPSPEGVYVWEADGYCQNGNHVNKKGNVSLLR
jgi:gliding motility-associated-like protein